MGSGARGRGARPAGGFFRDAGRAAARGFFEARALAFFGAALARNAFFLTRGFAGFLEVFFFVIERLRAAIVVPPLIMK